MRALVIIMVCALWGLPACAQDRRSDPGEGEPGRVVAITGPLSLQIAREADEVEVRLGAVNTPLEREAQAWLEAQAAGKSVEILSGDESRDRYQRLIGQVVIGAAGPDGGRVWVQEALIEAGLARFLAYGDTDAYAPALLAAEQRARSARRGLWADPAHGIRDPNPDRLIQDLGTLQLVEGRVMDVTRLDNGRTYINFGADWRTDFTIRIDERFADRFDRDTISALETYRVRVRGVIIDENGPMIRLAYPGRLERLED
ncbi:thermonuclease family protein [Maricaulis sp.]|uniref:thermonuclease family protein n=1 Tax=Maricaulis sp. TaxID=1486257 RepID=UPI0026212E06|nr:thermonuclease family protein [Maricaulis sp.]